MAAIAKRLLHLRPSFHSYTRPNPYPIQYHFSSSSDAEFPQPEPPGDPNSETQTRPSFSSKFNDVKASLQQPPPQNSHQAPSAPPQTTPRSGANSKEDLRRQLSEFRIGSAAPPPPPSSAGQYVSLQELYEKTVISKGEGPANSSGSNSGGKSSFDAIRASLRQHGHAATSDSGGKASDRWSLSRVTESLKLKAGQNANQNSTVITGGSESFIPSFLRNETMGKGDSNLGSMGFWRPHDHLELGKKLKMLRPEKRKGKWFSLHELSDRLAKVREAENKEMDANFGGSFFRDIRNSLVKVKQSDEEKARKGRMQTIGLLGKADTRKLSPPKNHLVEKYFHPDNMSSAEKLKLELKKVRDEFKMSVSDCGSARVQVAQLTTKIKHLSTVLQKKDKHSRRGLHAMVQRRKKLLKYLRRTDWDSYCLVLSKLGLRDNPDIKA